MATFDAATATRHSPITAPFNTTGISVASSANGNYPAGYASGYVDGLAAAPPPTSPTIAIVSPAPGTIAGDLPTAQATPLVVDIAQVGAYAVALVVVAVRYPGAASELVAYRRGSFRRGFTAHSYAETIGTTTRLHILPDSGVWPDSGDPDDIVIDVDAAAGAVSLIGASS